MEEILLRFSHIGQAIFKELNGKDFCKSKEVNRSWYHFINNERSLQTAYKYRIQEKIDILTGECTRFSKQTPFHLAAERGYLSICQEIMENTDDRNPKDYFQFTPLHLAARNGHLAVCQLIFDNTKDSGGWNLLHWAAENGHLSICELVVENVDDKNPKDIGG